MNVKKTSSYSAEWEGTDEDGEEGGEHVADVELFAEHQLAAVPEGQAVGGEHDHVGDAQAETLGETSKFSDFLREHQVSVVPVRSCVCLCFWWSHAVFLNL